MTIYVLRHKIEQELAIPRAQKFKYRFGADVPARWVDESERESIVADTSYCVQLVLKRAMKYMYLELRVLLGVPTKAGDCLRPPFAETELDFQPSDPLVFEIGAYRFQSAQRLIE